MRYGASSRCSDLAIVPGLAPEELPRGPCPCFPRPSNRALHTTFLCSRWLMRSAFQLWRKVEGRVPDLRLTIEALLSMGKSVFV